MARHRWALDIALCLEGQGWRYRVGSKHLMLYPADKTKQPFTIASTPGDHRAFKNAVAQIARAGADMELLSIHL